MYAIQSLQPFFLQRVLLPKHFTYIHSESEAGILMVSFPRVFFLAGRTPTTWPCCRPVKPAPGVPRWSSTSMSRSWCGTVGTRSSEVCVCGGGDCVQRQTDKQLCTHLKLSLTSIECPPSADVGGTLCEMTSPSSDILAGARSSVGMDLKCSWSRGAQWGLPAFCGDCDGD